ncbi:DNA-processing protein DprA [Streptomyces purpureus]|uniref:DNA-processing protein DprA n=1 Tax=Streptomyces purpureus TaxID=1951 RepID=UPI0037B5946A
MTPPRPQNPGTPDPSRNPDPSRIPDSARIPDPSPNPDTNPVGTNPIPDANRTAERLARAALTRTIEPGDQHGGRCLRQYGATGLLARLTTPTHQQGSLGPTGERRIHGWRTRAAAAHPEHDLATAHTHGIRFLIPGDPEWPTQLDDLGDARPIGLWARGPGDLRTWSLRSVAVVGARACTPYGTHTAAHLASGLAERGWVVTSGAAFGIDGAAHRGALSAGGATIAVLACGVDTAYPRGHAELIARITEQGLVVGELPPGSHPTQARFILRNRVIAALTRGTVVVEAEYRSGSLVTARNAQRLGRHTMGIPGPVTSGLSAGVHELLRGEATLVTDAADVIELVGDIGDLAPVRRGPVLPRDLLDPTAARVLEALPGHGALRAPDIALRASTHPDDTLAKLYELHALGFVERHGDDWTLSHPSRGTTNQRRGGT